MKSRKIFSLIIGINFEKKLKAKNQKKISDYGCLFLNVCLCFDVSASV